MSIIQRRSLMVEASRRYLYYEGDEFTDVTGGWNVAGYNRSSYHPIGTFTKAAKSLNYTQLTGGGSREEWYKRGWATAQQVDVTKAKALCVVFANDFTIPRWVSPTDPSVTFPSMVGIALTSTLTDTNAGQTLSGALASSILNWGTEVKAGKVYKLDISAVTGSAFVTVYFGVYMGETPYNANISSIWLD